MYHGIGHIGYCPTRHQTWDLSPSPAPRHQTWDLPNPLHTTGHQTWDLLPATDIWSTTLETCTVCNRAVRILLESIFVSTYFSTQKKLQSKLKNEHRQNIICKDYDTVPSEIKTHFCFVFGNRKSKYRLFGDEWCSVASLCITQHVFSIGYVLHHSDTQRSNI